MIGQIDLAGAFFDRRFCQEEARRLNLKFENSSVDIGRIDFRGDFPEG